MTETKKLLIVEDDRQYREILNKLLQDENIVVRLAENGQVALEMMEKEDFDLIILDLLMPEMSGWNFMYELQKTDKANIPILILTNLSRASYASGVPSRLDFITKADVSVDEVVSRVKKHLMM